MYILMSESKVNSDIKRMVGFFHTRKAARKEIDRLRETKAGEKCLYYLDRRYFWNIERVIAWIQGIILYLQERKRSKLLAKRERLDAKISHYYKR